MGITKAGLKPQVYNTPIPFSKMSSADATHCTLAWTSEKVNDKPHTIDQAQSVP